MYLYMYIHILYVCKLSVRCTAVRCACMIVPSRNSVFPEVLPKYTHVRFPQLHDYMYTYIHANKIQNMNSIFVGVRTTLVFGSIDSVESSVRALSTIGSTLYVLIDVIDWM